MAPYFEKLIVWQKAFQLSKNIYILTKNFPKEEQYSLTDQIRRCSVSIVSNIAEGSGRGTNSERNHFYHIAKGSSMELYTQLLLAKEFGYIESQEEVQTQLDLIDEIIRIIYTLTKS